MAAALIAGAQEESRPELMELWARLLANAMDPNLNSVRQSFIEAVKKMDPVDAVVVRHLHEAKIMLVLLNREEGSSTQITGSDDIARAINRRSDEVELSMRHLKDLSLLDEHSSTVGEDDEQVEELSWWINAAGREFLRACYPEVKATR
jgi:hypothetical protein